MHSSNDQEIKAKKEVAYEWFWYEVVVKEMEITT